MIPAPVASTRHYTDCENHHRISGEGSDFALIADCDGGPQAKKS